MYGEYNVLVTVICQCRGNEIDESYTDMPSAIMLVAALSTGLARSGPMHATPAAIAASALTPRHYWPASMVLQRCECGSRAGAQVMMAARRKASSGRGRSVRSRPPTKSTRGIDSKIPSLIYYGAYCAFFGKLAIALLERATT